MSLLLTGAGNGVNGSSVNFVNSTEETTSTSYSHTTSGSDRLLILSINQGFAADVTGVTYNSVSMTHITDIDEGLRNGSLWYLVAPAIGSNTVAITQTFGVIASSASTWTGVNQSTPWEGLVSDELSLGSANLSVTVLTVATNGVTFEMVIADDGTYSPASGQTVLSDQDDGSDHMATGYEVGTGANMTQEWTRPDSSSAELAAIRLNPV